MASKGYITNWKPSADTRYWTQATQEVMDDLRRRLPLTVRQIFYRLVAVYGYEKSEQGYGKLTRILGDARKAEVIPWENIRDGGQGKSIGAFFYDSGEAFEEHIESAARHMRLDRQLGQPKVIELWCEAGGMVPILQDIASPYGLRVNSGGGYDSVTSKHYLAVRVMERARKGQGTLILHVGDFDGSGENMCDVLREDAGAMARTQIMRSLGRTYRSGRGGWEDVDPKVWTAFDDKEPNDAIYDLLTDAFAVERVALTGRQVVDRQVITAPPKKSDSRTRAFVENNWEIVEELGTEEISAQLEALHPDDLDALVAEVIEEHLDMGVYRAQLERETEVRTDLLDRLGYEPQDEEEDYR